MNEFIDRIAKLPSRKGAPPRMTPTNPQEQLEQFPEDWGVIETLAAYAFSLARVVERPTHIAPPGSRALTLNSKDASHDRNAFMVDLEFAHIHNPPVGSMHLTLPAEVRDAAIAKGWALRHPLAVRNIVSPDVTFVFAPRNDEELQRAKVLLDASHAYASTKR
jgi:phospholipase/carboxylesterase